MPYVIFNVVAFLLLLGFFAMTWYEERKGARFLEADRARLDAEVMRATSFASTVDFNAFIKGETRRAITHLGHSLVSLSLQAVRAAERLLTRLFRYLRTMHPIDATPSEARPFLKTLSDFKERLKETRRSDAPDEIE